MKYRVVSNTAKGSAVFTAFIKGRPRMVTSQHPKFRQIVAAARDDRPAEEILDLIDLGNQIAKSLSRVTKKFKRDADGRITFKGVALPSPLMEHLKRMVDSGDGNYLAFARAVSRIAANPSENARESLYRWMQNGDLSFDSRGFLVAYKGLTSDALSIHHGTASVNGVEINGRIPNDVGNVVTMPREDVDPDTNVGCSYGLHIGTFGYAADFGEMLALVAVDPADIVSVPLDCDSSKIRCCRYEVVAHLEKPQPIGATFYGDYDDSEDLEYDGNFDEEEWEEYDDDEEDWEDDGGDDEDDLGLTISY